MSIARSASLRSHRSANGAETTGAGAPSTIKSRSTSKHRDTVCAARSTSTRSGSAADPPCRGHTTSASSHLTASRAAASRASVSQSVPESSDSIAAPHIAACRWTAPRRTESPSVTGASTTRGPRPDPAALAMRSHACMQETNDPRSPSQRTNVPWRVLTATAYPLDGRGVASCSRRCSSAPTS